MAKKTTSNLKKSKALNISYSEPSVSIDIKSILLGALLKSNKSFSEMVSTLYSAIGISTSVSNLEKPKIEECSAIADSLKVNNSPVFDHTHRLSIVDCRLSIILQFFVPTFGWLR